ncbi:ATP-dependent helicase [Alkaliphilus peptidifermentans]|uniref:DNA 3'-5' helicase n=1 Tax=Alkaliphilus peptidifermentans DSM 18978 TaxID=1120976 RepID=A0A1G5CFF9_9FIRM|nr:ATP-dependent helicase [Alkaliphilus peptidifermentans]SCY01219.1 DNA helicase-2 / ATP-dependent DNA helicase PcrA [Alkaliphilus peptidifermentans DSM 18978]
MDLYKYSLNNKQLEAVTHKDGPCIVYAGPGSGKTTIITHRIGNLIKNHNVSGENILVITFTKAAAEEMRLRFGKLMGGSDGKGVNFGTFHAVFYKIIRRYFGLEMSNIINEKDRRNVIKNIIKTLEVENPYNDDLIKEILQEIGLYKSNHYLVGNYSSNVLSDNDFQRVIDCYEAYKKDLGKIDFDDMLTKCYDILSKERKLLENLRNQFQYILIDEFQDINAIQFEIIKMLSAPKNNIFVVGDDDQSIYSFRGAKPEFILEFEQIYPDLNKISVQRNYRSQQAIIIAANQLISNNNFRVNKNMEPTITSSKTIEYYSPLNREEENRRVFDIITDAVKRGHQYKDIAVIYRTNLLANGLVDILLDNKIPFICKDQIDNIYDHWIARDIIAYMKAAHNQLDNNSIIAIINRPTRYVTKKSIREASEYHKDLITSLKLKGGLLPYQLKLVEELEVDLKSLRHMEFKEAISFIRKKIGYNQYIVNYCLEKNIPSNGFFDILDEFEEACGKYKDLNSYFAGMEAFRNQIRNKPKDNDDNRVSLLTMHSAKGLEYEVVIITSAIEEIVPHSKSVSCNKMLEEERRLFYVAITRAKDELYILSPKNRYDRKVEASRFIEEMKCYQMERSRFFKGKEIIHKAFGHGSVIDIIDNILKIRFSSNEIKDFDLDTCIKNNIFR